MAEFPAMRLWTDAYLADTTHLTTIQHGAYLLLLITAWRIKDHRLPDDDHLLAAYCKLTLGQWLRIRPRIEPFWRIADGFWSNGRLLDELEAVRQQVRQRSDAGKRSALKRLNRDATGVQRNVNESPTPIPIPIPIPITRESLTGTTSVSESENPPSTHTGRARKKARTPLMFGEEDFLPKWVPKEAWTAFVAMRRASKHPATEQAIKLLILRLTELKTAGEDPEAVLNQSTRVGWADLWPVKSDLNGGANTAQASVTASILKELVAKDDKP